MAKIISSREIAQWTGYPKVKFNCGDSLFLEQRSAGAAKTWIVRIRVNGVVKERKLGVLSEMTLEEARELAAVVREQASHGIYVPSLGPMLAFLGLDELPDASTFGGLAARYAMQQGAANASQRIARDAAWVEMLALKESPIWRLPTQSLTVAQAFGALRLQAIRYGPESAARAQASIRAVIQYALDHRFIRGSAVEHMREAVWDDAARGAMGAMGAMGAPGAWATGSTVSAQQLGEALWRAQATYSTPQVKLGLVMLAMTVQPVDDVVAVRWDNLDLPNALWRIPPRPLGRPPSTRHPGATVYGEKIVPLPSQLVAALRAVDQVHPYVCYRPKGDHSQHVTAVAMFAFMRNSLGLRQMFAPKSWSRAFQGWAESEGARQAAPVEDAGCMAYILKRSHVRLEAVGAHEEGVRTILQAWADELQALERLAARAAQPGFDGRA